MMNETVSTINGDDKCQTCGNTMDWHKEHNPVHPFNTGASGAAAFLGRRRDRDEKPSQRGPQTPARVPFPVDPILRQALVDKGILTPQDLKDAEEKIMAITGLFNQSMPPQTPMHYPPGVRGMNLNLEAQE